ncbi:MAG: DUF1365 family protein [Actinophytocola sp.]|uniref:DUF1365 domain-containing protein n=1 Tax=Actinophytocola sp. TaxID=1872138 RepID=UPI001323DCF2|nr:DUF1365 domain-containing protein [Actinophytocola sp.]MPZ81350.1 DUF1365 family protein [Actinophytocola sp.]
MTTGYRPTIYTARLVHVRRERLDRRFTSRMRPWLVDLDALPHRPPLATFEARDHLGRPDRTVRQNLDGWLARHGVVAGGRVLMLAMPRTFGYVFNPLTVFWCFDPAGAPVCVVAEVHNTYGERHCYLLRPDAGWRAGAAKELYVSPFLEVAGDYRMHLPPPGERLSLSVVLHRDGRPVFTAVLTGRRRGAATAGRALRHALAWPPLRVRALIQLHGVALWLRRLPVVPRRPHVPQEGVQ